MKNDSRVNNNYKSVTKRAFCIIVAVVVLVVSVVGVNAANTNPSWDFESANQPLVVSQNPMDGESYKHQRRNVTYYDVRYTSTKSNTFACANGLLQYFMCAEEFEIYANYGYTDNVVHWYSGWNDTYNAYTIRYNESFNCDAYYEPTYESEQECYEALAYIVDNPPAPPVTGKPLNYTLPAGNIVYLEIDNSLFNGVNLATIMPELSGVGSGDPWSLSSQFYAMTDDMLLNGASVYDLNGTRIVWNKSPNASTNLLGQTDHAVWESQGPYPNKTYFVICNPFYFFDNENNSSITIVANGIKNVYVQPLKTVVQQNGNEISYNTTVDGGTYEGEVTDDLGPIEWTDPDGGSTAPGTSTSNTPVTGINQFQQWLQGILQQIISVFEPAHDAITTLASAVQNFSGWLKALYVWLPSPVLNLLTSAISLAIIIGVIKVFI